MIHELFLFRFNSLQIIGFTHANPTSPAHRDRINKENREIAKKIQKHQDIPNLPNTLLLASGGDSTMDVPKADVPTRKWDQEHSDPTS